MISPWRLKLVPNLGDFPPRWGYQGQSLQGFTMAGHIELEPSPEAIQVQLG